MQIDSLPDEPVPACPDETDWHTLWQRRQLDHVSPTARAMYGGALADRLAWVFVSGYQAAVAHTFGPTDGWAALVASEDRSAPEVHPGVRLTRDAADNWVLSGHKSWVAHSRHVSSMIVTARRDDPATGRPGWCNVRVAASAPGVHLRHREAPTFLAALSQGFAHFDAVRIVGQDILDGADARGFGQVEAPFVRLAGAVFLLRRATDATLRSRLTEVINTLATACEAAAAATPPVLTATTADEMNGAVDQLDAQLADAVPDWHADRRLLTMYRAPR